MRIIAAILLSLLALPSLAMSEQVANLTFNDGTFGGFTTGAFWAVQPGGPDGSTAARLEYSEAGNNAKSISIPVGSYASNEYTVEFDVKIEGTPYGGCKFLKFFGDVTASRNNTTFQLNYSGRNFYEVSYYGDVNCTNRFAGGGYATCGSAYQTTTSAIDPTGGAWHHYKAWLKRADPGQTNGEVKVWWDGTLRLYVSGMDSNPAAFLDPTPGFFSIEIGGYNMASSNGGVDGYFADGITPTWYLWVDNVAIDSGATETTVSCDASHLYLCTTQTPCLAAGGYWWSDSTCHSSQEVITGSSSIRSINGELKKVNGHLIGISQ